jgi:hypothetical protein
MDNEEKCKIITDWVDPEERVTVDFRNEGDLNAEVAGCTRELVDLTLDTTVPHMRQQVSLPLREVEVLEDRTRYTRDPERPLRRGRLRLVVNGDRPPWIP